VRYAGWKDRGMKSPTLSFGHLVDALALKPEDRRAALERLIRAAGPQVLALEADAVRARGSVWVFDDERRAQAEPEEVDPRQITVELLPIAYSRLLLTTWGAIGVASAPTAPPAGGYHLCLVDGDDVCCLAIGSSVTE
jgi:hypothetical protein